MEEDLRFLNIKLEKILPCPQSPCAPTVILHFTLKNFQLYLLNFEGQL